MATMRTATLELLERAKLPTEQALALAQAIELEVASQREAMVTRSDFLELRGEFRSELGPLKTDVAGLKADVSELKADVVQLKADVVQLKADVVQLKADVSELKADMSELKRGFAQLGNDMLEWKSEIRVEMHAIKAELVRWVFTVMLGQTAVLLGGGYFILSLLVA
jgi:chromosome segregation ATPase